LKNIAKNLDIYSLSKATIGARSSRKKERKKEPAPDLPPCTILPTHHPDLVLLILQHSDNSYKFGNFLMIFVTFWASSLDDHHFG
jgi:hypothetical protein